MVLNRFLIFLYFAFLLILQSNAQLVTEEWAKRYTVGNSGDESRSIAVDDSGNVFITGQSYLFTWPNQEIDYCTIKYNASGVQQWVQRTPGTGWSIALDDSSNVYVTGAVYGSTAGIGTIKYNSMGIIQWFQIYNAHITWNDTAVGKMIKLDRKHNVYVTGTTNDSVHSRGYTTIKYSSGGEQLWVARYNGPYWVDEAAALAIDDSDNVYVTGRSLGPPPQEWDFATVKYNSNGQQVWVKKYGDQSGYYANYAECIIVDKSSNVYVSGSGHMNSYSIITIKYSSSGSQIWLRGYNSSGEPREIITDTYDNIYVAGHSYIGAIPYSTTLKYDSSGQQLFNVQYPNSEASSIAIDLQGNFYIGGGVYLGSNVSACLTIKYSFSGKQQWIQLYSYYLQPRDGISAIAVDKLGNVYVTGQSWGGLSTQDDYITIKYSQVNGIQKKNKDIQTKFYLYQNYPNPFNPETKINFALPIAGKVKLVVYDILGAEVKTLVNEYRQAGYHSVTFSSENLANGVYFYRIEAGDFNQVKKMVLVK